MDFKKGTIERMQTFPEFSHESPEELMDLLRSTATEIMRTYQSDGHKFLWDTIDKFALHSISANGALDEKSFERALNDLRLSETQYDVLSAEQQNALYSVDTHCHDLLVVSNRASYHEHLRALATADNDREYLLECLRRLHKPSVLDDSQLVDKVMKHIWSRIISTYNGTFIDKRLKRLAEIERVIQNIKY